MAKDSTVELEHERLVSKKSFSSVSFSLSIQARFYVGAEGRGQLPPNVSFAPKSLLTAAVCSNKTKQLYIKRFWRVDLVVLACCV